MDPHERLPELVEDRRRSLISKAEEFRFATAVRRGNKEI
jgi:hypothetical protein